MTNARPGNSMKFVLYCQLTTKSTLIREGLRAEGMHACHPCVAMLSRVFNMCMRIHTTQWT